MKEIYNVDYFIRKFEAIPEERWITGAFVDPSGNCCAFGHCGVRSGDDVFHPSSEAYALWEVFNNESVSQWLRMGAHGC